MSKKIKKIISPLFFLLGLGLFISLIAGYDWEQIQVYISKLQWKILIILFLPLVWYFLQSLAWYHTIEETGAHISVFKLLMIKLGGESVNTLTPASFAGGDPIRFYFLQKTMSKSLSTASIVLDRTVQTLAVILFLFSGLLIGQFSLELPEQWKIILPVIILVLFLVIILVILGQNKGLFHLISKLLAKVGFKKHLGEDIQKKLVEIDQRIAKFYKHNRRRFFIVLCLHYLARVVGIFEILFIATFLDIPIGFSQSWMLASVSVLVNILFVFIPGSLGVMEGAYGVILKLMGQTTVMGLSIQLVRRMRVLFWIFMGLIFMFIFKRLQTQKKENL